MGNACCSQKENNLGNEIITTNQEENYIKFADLVQATVGNYNCKTNFENIDCDHFDVDQENLDDSFTLKYSAKGSKNRIFPTTFISFPESQPLIEQSKIFMEKQKLPALQESNGCLYTGEWLNGQKNGQGVLFWPDGSVYEGSFQVNMPHGWGTLVHTSGDIYYGQWIKGQANGFGTFKMINGSVYEGQWENDVQNGQGTEKWPDGSFYRGQFINGIKNGNGILRFADGGQYSGEFKDGIINGKGQYKWVDGKQFDGEWLFNQMHGKGCMLWPDGRKYIGVQQFIIFRNIKKTRNVVQACFIGMTGEFTMVIGTVVNNMGLEFTRTSKGQLKQENGQMAKDQDG